MKKNGFTLVEVLAVIVILGILSSMAVLSVSQYRLKVKEKEKVNLHATIEAAYDNMRRNAVLKNGTIYENFCNGENIVFNISYNGDSLSCKSGDVNQISGTMKLYVKGKLIGKYSDEENMIKDGICKVSTNKSGESLSYSCERDDRGNIVPSEEEILCVKLSYENKYDSEGNQDILNDYNTNSICKQFEE